MFPQVRHERRTAGSDLGRIRGVTLRLVVNVARGVLKVFRPELLQFDHAIIIHIAQLEMLQHVLANGPNAGDKLAMHGRHVIAHFL